MNSKRIALVEIGGSHDECLLTQMHALHKENFEIFLFTTQEIIDRNPVFSQYITGAEVFELKGSKSDRKQEISRLWKEIKGKGIAKVVLNTAQGNDIRRLTTKAWFSKVEFIGIIHTIRMFQGSFTQKWISTKVKKYFVLSEFLLQQTKVPKGISIDYFYPIRFPDLQPVAPKSKKRICIIGGVENRRKDLEGFLNLIGKVSSDSYEFVFLGKSDPTNPDVEKFLDAANDRGLADKIRTYDHFVSAETFDGVLKSADLILPLIHPGTPSADQYFRNQISGAMSVSFAYKIPMLLHEGYAHIEEMQPASFYYNEQSFPAILEEAMNSRDARTEAMKNHEAYQVDYQEERFLAMIK